jgi:hypothetical protein
MMKVLIEGRNAREEMSRNSLLQIIEGEED